VCVRFERERERQLQLIESESNILLFLCFLTNESLDKYKL
jgi:hypothetical protein